MAAEYDLSIDQGATFRQSFRWEAGNPPVGVDLTGCSALMHIRSRLRDLSPLLVASTANGKITLDSLGNILVYLPPSDTKKLTAKDYVYDLEITMANGDVVCLVGGKAHPLPQVTR